MSNSDHMIEHGTEIRYNLRAASAWRMLCEIFRRFQQQNDFRLFEVHPHSYDCLSVAADPMLCRVDFHLSDGTIHSHGYEGPMALKMRSYVTTAITSMSVVSAVEDLGREFGWGQPCDAGIRVNALLCMEVIAELMNRYAFRDKALEARSGWARFEYGDELRPWLKDVSWAREKLRDVEERDEARRMQVGRRVWRLSEASVNSLQHGGGFGEGPLTGRAVTLNFSTGVAVLQSEQHNTQVELAKLFREGKLPIRSAANLLEDTLAGPS